MEEHQIIGTTVYIGRTELETVYGMMTAYTFQDLIHKGYIIALAHGNLRASTLYTRLHSSCVTSELMRSLDCDCVQQLNGAIKKICSGDGILFYLIQEGRGCGYVGKSRACMAVQYYEETELPINTFQAYDSLGMCHDYRQYTNVSDIIKILRIEDSRFILLTNNPDKIEKFGKLGLNLHSVESIEVPPNPFNQTYLHSKEQYGHILYQAKTKVQKYTLPYQRIRPFTPYSLPNCRRFIHVSSYYLPIKPVWNRIVMNKYEYDKYGNNNNYQIIHNPADHNNHSYYVQMTDDEIKENPQLSHPNWFQVNVHYDLITNEDYLVLRYGECDHCNRVPVVRIHSESIFNRFPLIDREYKDRYKRSIDQIIKNGCGIILIFYSDGRGSGLGYYVMNQNNQNNIGVESDKRDYYGAINLLKHYIDHHNNPTKEIDLLSGDTSHDTLEDEFKKHNIKIRRMIRLSNNSEKKGVHSIDHRIRSLREDTHQMLHQLDMEQVNNSIRAIRTNIDNIPIYSTGIGSSESHSRYLEFVFDKKIRHINAMEAGSLSTTKNYLLIVFSQGLSPNIIYALQGVDMRNVILITTVNRDTGDVRKRKFIERLMRHDGRIINYPRETPDNTLIRITGPFIGYWIGLLIAMMAGSNHDNTRLIQLKDIINRVFELHENHNHHESNNFVSQLSRSRKLIICCDTPAISLVDNLRYKIIEGAMIDTHKADYISFAHGMYQFIANTENNHDNYCIWFITKKDNQMHERTIELLGPHMRNNLHTTYYEEHEKSVLPMLLELESNNMVFHLIQMIGINQLEWPGKGRQSILYDTIE